MQPSEIKKLVKKARAGETSGLIRGLLDLFELNGWDIHNDEHVEEYIAQVKQAKKANKRRLELWKIILGK
jgi:hypothetical protein